MLYLGCYTHSISTIVPPSLFWVFADMCSNILVILNKKITEYKDTQRRPQNYKYNKQGKHASSNSKAYNKDNCSSKKILTKYFV